MISISTTLNNIRACRKNILGILQSLSHEQINQIPKGFNNNLIWNYGHVIVTQQLLNYGLSGIPMLLDKEIITRYRKGSKPEGEVSIAEFEALQALAQSTLDQTHLDYEAGKLANFKEYPTSFGITLHSIDEAITFNALHEALHLGSCLALRRAILAE